MKRKMIALVTAIIIAMTAQAQRPFFKKCENVKGVTTVYISNAMLKMAGNIEGLGVSDKSLLSKKIDNVQIVNSENSEGRAYLDKHLGMISPEKGYEILMKINEDDENVTIYRQDLDKKKSRFVVITKEPDEISVVTIEGAMTIEDVSRCVKK